MNVSSTDVFAPPRPLSSRDGHSLPPERDATDAEYADPLGLPDFDAVVAHASTTMPCHDDGSDIDLDLHKGLRGFDFAPPLNNNSLFAILGEAAMLGEQPGGEAPQAKIGEKMSTKSVPSSVPVPYSEPQQFPANVATPSPPPPPPTASPSAKPAGKNRSSGSGSNGGGTNKANGQPLFNRALEEKWSKRLSELRIYRKQHGHCLVPHCHKENLQLARWVKRQRRQYKLRAEGKPSTLTDERVRLLDDVGFVWDSHSAGWNDKIRSLMEYKARYGDCLVPSSYEANPGLAIWVKCQRRQYKLLRDGKNSSMTRERARHLRNIGFCFEVRGGGGGRVSAARPSSLSRASGGGGAPVARPSSLSGLSSGSGGGSGRVSGPVSTKASPMNHHPLDAKRTEIHHEEEPCTPLVQGDDLELLFKTISQL